MYVLRTRVLWETYGQREWVLSFQVGTDRKIMQKENRNRPSVLYSSSQATPRGVILDHR